MPDAAAVLGISAEAVRMRIKRGTLHSERQGGRVFVVLGPDRPTERTPEEPGESGTLTSQMQARIESLEHQLEEANERAWENRRIIAALTSRIPAIEAPSEAEPRSPPRRSRRLRIEQSPTPLREGLRRAHGARGGVGCSGDEGQGDT